MKLSLKVITAAFAFVAVASQGMSMVDPNAAAAAAAAAAQQQNAAILAQQGMGAPGGMPGAPMGMPGGMPGAPMGAPGFPVQ